MCMIVAVHPIPFLLMASQFLIDVTGIHLGHTLDLIEFELPQSVATKMTLAPLLPNVASQAIRKLH